MNTAVLLMIVIVTVILFQGLSSSTTDLGSNLTSHKKHSKLLNVLTLFDRYPTSKQHIKYQRVDDLLRVPVLVAFTMGQTEHMRKQAQCVGDVLGSSYCYLTGSGRIFKASQIKSPKRLNGLLSLQRQIADKRDNQSQALICLVI